MSGRAPSSWNLYERFSRFEAVIIDPHALGATALMGVEKTGRIYRGAKPYPAHVQAVLEKWKEFSGVEA